MIERCTENGMYNEDPSFFIVYMSKYSYGDDMVYTGTLSGSTVWVSVEQIL